MPLVLVIHTTESGCLWGWATSRQKQGVSRYHFRFRQPSWGRPAMGGSSRRWCWPLRHRNITGTCRPRGLNDSHDVIMHATPWVEAGAAMAIAYIAAMAERLHRRLRLRTNNATDQTLASPMSKILIEHFPFIGSSRRGPASVSTSSVSNGRQVPRATGTTGKLWVPRKDSG